MSSIARPLTRGLSLGWGLAFVAVTLVAVAGTWLWSERTGDTGVGAARNAASRAGAAEAAVAELSDDVDRLERQLASITAQSERSADRLGRVKETLWGSLQRLRADLAAARAGSKEALAGVGAAAAEAESAVRKLSVLEDRFEYHLRADHGGG